MRNKELQAELLVLLINLDRSTDRLQRMQTRLSKQPCQWERISAVDGRALTFIPNNLVNQPLYEAQHGKPVALAEIGCYLSHVHAMRHFLTTDKPFLLILEDDAVLDSNFSDVLNNLLNMPTDSWDVVKLSGFHNPRIIGKQKLFDQYVLGIPTMRHCNTAAVLYSRYAAEQFLSHMLPMNLPFDHALEQPWIYQVKLRVVQPDPVGAGDESESTIVATKSNKFKWYKRISTYVFRAGNECRRLGWAISQRFCR